MMDPGLGQSSSGRPKWDGWTWFWLGVPFALSGSLAAETASARETRDVCRGRREFCTVWDKVSGLADVVQERRLEGTSRAERRRRSMRCQVPRVLVDVLGVHEDGWMRWVAVEPCQLELRVSLWGDQSPESPFSILHLAGLWPQG